MAAQILPFPGQSPPITSPIARYLRVGEAHQQLAGIYATGRLIVDRVVFDASRLKHQYDFATMLREADAHLVLDTEAAELAARAKYAGHVRRAPWARCEALGPDTFRHSAANICGEIAQFAVDQGFDTVLARSHFIGDPDCRDWLKIDQVSCLDLRSALDKAGGSHIGIDYPVIVPAAMIADRSKREEIVSSLSDLPIENAWLRISGMEAEAGPLMLKRYLEALIACQDIGVPIVADHIGGLAGNAALAFGAASGIANGAGERERFDAGQWHKAPVPKEDGTGFGRKVRVSMPGMQGSLTREELDVLVSARGGRKLCACADRACCLHGYDDMRKDPRGHAARQQAKAISALEMIPDLRRPSHFLDGPLRHAETLSRSLEVLRPTQAVADEKKVNLDRLMERMQKRARKRAEVVKVLKRMDEQRGGEWSRARPIARRQSFGPLSRRGRP